MRTVEEIQAEALDAIADECAALVRPRRDIGIAEWGAAHRRLTRETAAREGPYDPTITPWMAEIYACLHPDHPADTVAVMKCQQSGLTDLALTWLAYTLVEDPGPWLVVQPTIADQKAFVQSRVAALRANTDVLCDMPADDTDNLQMVVFQGAVVRYGNAGSKGSLSSQPVRYVLLDEAAKYPQDTQGGGDPIAMARGRTTTFRSSRKILIISTPEIAGACAMESAYLAGDRRRYHIPCPECGTMQELVYERLTNDARYRCDGCNGLIEEHRKTWMLARGEWRATNPDGTHPSFHVSGLMRPLGWDGWAECRRAMTSATTPSERKAAMTLQLGLPYEDVEEVAVAPRDLLLRAEDYRAPVPSGVVLLTAGVDVQGDRLECYTYGWGEGEESWLVDRHIIRSGPDRPEAWAALEEHLSAAWQHESAGPMTISAVGIDAGYRTQVVYEFVQRFHGRRRWYAVMGSPTSSAIVWPRKPVHKRPKGGTGRIPLYVIGAVQAKEALLGRIGIAQAGPGFLHLPRWADLDYAEQLLAEHRQVQHLRRGRIEIRYTLPAGRRNEALDCYVYAYAVLKALEADGVTLRRVLASQADVRQDAPVSAAPAAKKAPPKPWGAQVNAAWGARRR